ncbi:nuclear transport factor 2 family protein [Actinospongicola halichondriae]|uniref:nuclear transport factor 2 family protein n=1 Tax=Actinospongicola halichondriae TaxID=3236844 RepID=UPI003D4997A0
MGIEDEARTAYTAYCETRTKIVAGDLPWSALEDHFTDDAVFIDPAWGRVEGIDALREFWVESMMGLEGWRFPEAWTMVEGNRVVSMWWQEMGDDADGKPVKCPGISILYYAGDGRFAYEHDLMNMAHVMEGVTASGWTPTGEFNMPPTDPNRDVSLPDHLAHLTKDLL